MILLKTYRYESFDLEPLVIEHTLLAMQSHINMVYIAGSRSLPLAMW
jgi:hypothetical protein